MGTKFEYSFLAFPDKLRRDVSVAATSGFVPSIGKKRRKRKVTTIAHFANRIAR